MKHIRITTSILTNSHLKFILLSVETEDQKEVFDEILDQLEEEREELEQEEQVLMIEQQELQKEEVALEVEEDELTALEQDELKLKQEEEEYKLLLKQKGGKEGSSDLQEMLKQIQLRRESMKRHKLKLGKILQHDGIDGIKKVSLTRSIAHLHEWHENKKKKLAEKQRIAQEKRRIEEDEKVIHTHSNGLNTITIIIFIIEYMYI